MRVGKSLDALVKYSSSSSIFPKTHAIHTYMRNPNGIVMAVRLRIMGVPHSRQRTSARSDNREQKGPAQIRREVIAREFFTVALKRNLVVGKRHRLHFGHELGGRP